MENIITEFRVIETDEGFRIEIKGDKEKIKTFFSDFGNSKRRQWKHRPGHGHPKGPLGFHPMMWERMASCWGSWTEEPENEQK